MEGLFPGERDRESKFLYAFAQGKGKLSQCSEPSNVVSSNNNNKWLQGCNTMECRQESKTWVLAFYCWLKKRKTNFLGDAVVKNSPANAGNMGLIPGWEDPICHRATKLVCHNYEACLALESMLLNKRSHCNEKSTHGNYRKPAHSSEDPAQPNK